MQPQISYDDLLRILALLIQDRHGSAPVPQPLSIQEQLDHLEAVVLASFLDDLQIDSSTETSVSGDQLINQLLDIVRSGHQLLVEQEYLNEDGDDAGALDRVLVAYLRSDDASPTSERSKAPEEAGRSPRSSERKLAKAALLAWRLLPESTKGLYVTDPEKRDNGDVKVSSSYLDVVDRHFQTVLAEGRYARARLLVQYYRLAFKIVARYKDETHYSWDDLGQIAVSCLIEALPKVPFYKVSKPSNYVGSIVGNHVQTIVFDDEALVRLPMQTSLRVGKLNRAIDRWRALNGEEPTDLQLTIETGMSLKQIHNLQAFKRLRNMDIYGDDALSTSESDPIEPRDIRQLDKAALTHISNIDQEWSAMMVLLTPKERVALELWFGLNLEQNERGRDFSKVGEHLGISRQAARETIIRALRKLYPHSTTES